MGLLILAAEAVPTGPMSVSDANWFLANAWLIPLLPALSFAAILAFGKRMPRRGSELGLVAVGASFLLAVAAAVAWVAHHGAHETAPAVHRSVSWLVSGGVRYDAGILVDGLSVMMLVVVTAVSLLVHVYSTDYVAGDARYTHFFAFLSLFTAAMLFFVLSDNLLQMIVGWSWWGCARSCSSATGGRPRPTPTPPSRPSSPTGSAMWACWWA